jgi:hypothetical protein
VTQKEERLQPLIESDSNSGLSRIHFGFNAAWLKPWPDTHFLRFSIRQLGSALVI